MYQMSEAILMAFSTASSSATLPVTMECAEHKAGISKRSTEFVIPLGAALVSGGFAMMSYINDPIGLYVAMGLLIVNGSMSMSYIVHSMFLPNWFVRNRGLAFGIAFSGVGVGASCGQNAPA